MKGDKIMDTIMNLIRFELPIMFSMNMLVKVLLLLAVMIFVISMFLSINYKTHSLKVKMGRIMYLFIPRYIKTSIFVIIIFIIKNYLF